MRLVFCTYTPVIHLQSIHEPIHRFNPHHIIRQRFHRRVIRVTLNNGLPADWPVAGLNRRECTTFHGNRYIGFSDRSMKHDILITRRYGASGCVAQQCFIYTCKTDGRRPTDVASDVCAGDVPQTSQATAHRRREHVCNRRDVTDQFGMVVLVPTTSALWWDSGSGAARA